MKDTKENRQEFRICVQAMFVCLGGEFSEAAILGYWIALSDLTLEEVQQACYQAMRSSRCVPKPVELRELVHGRGSDRAIAAWGDVQRAIPMGPYKHIDFLDKLINAVIRSMGGWPNFLSRLTDAEQEKWARHEFTRCYAALANSGVDGDMCLPLAGLAQVQVINGKVHAALPSMVACDAQREKLKLRHAPAVKSITQLDAWQCRVSRLSGEAT